MKYNRTDFLFPVDSIEKITDDVKQLAVTSSYKNTKNQATWHAYYEVWDALKSEDDETPSAIPYCNEMSIGMRIQNNWILVQFLLPICLKCTSCLCSTTFTYLIFKNHSILAKLYSCVFLICICKTCFSFNKDRWNHSTWHDSERYSVYTDPGGAVRK